MTEPAMISRLRLDKFDPAIHRESQRTRHWPDHALIPRRLKDGSLNPDWEKAAFGVRSRHGLFELYPLGNP